MRYRRDDTKGGTWFFTVNLAERNKTFLMDEFDLLRDVMNRVKGGRRGSVLTFYIVSYL